MDNERYKRIRETINNRQAADGRQRAKLQGAAAQPAQPTQPTQPTQPIKAPSEQISIQPVRPQAQTQQARVPQAEPQSTGPAYQTYEQTGAAAQPAQPITAPSEQQGQQTPEAGGSYTSPYQQQINDLYQQITGRKPFSYDIDQDAMWQSLKADYQRMGKKAMQDTMGRAAGLTGGYGSSYGQAAGQAAYDEYLTQLSERAPELYDRALRRYQAEGDDMRDNLGILLQRDSDDYNRFRTERAYADERADLDYQRQQKEREYNDSRADKEYQRQQDERNYIMSLIQYGYNPTDDDLAAAGMSREEADQIAAVWRAGNPDMAYRLGLISADDYYRMTGQYPAGYTPPVSETPVETGTGGDGGSSNSMWDNNTSARGRNARDESNPGRPGGTYGNSGQGYQYGSGIPAQQFYSIESAIANAGSPAAAMSQFDKITDSTFKNMSKAQLDRLSAAMRKAGT